MKHPSAKSILTCTINTFFIEIVDMASFQLGEELRRWFFRLVTSVGQRKNYFYPKNMTLSTLLILAVCRTRVI